MSILNYLENSFLIEKLGFSSKIKENDVDKFCILLIFIYTKKHYLLQEYVDSKPKNERTLARKNIIHLKYLMAKCKPELLKIFQFLVNNPEAFRQEHEFINSIWYRSRNSEEKIKRMYMTFKKDYTTDTYTYIDGLTFDSVKIPENQHDYFIFYCAFCFMEQYNKINKEIKNAHRASAAQHELFSKFI